jgi:hypothetical protein
MARRNLITTTCYACERPFGRLSIQETCSIRCAWTLRRRKPEENFFSKVRVSGPTIAIFG